MNILFENSGYHLRNLGDVAMLQTAYDITSKVNPQATCRIFTSAPERLQILCPKAVPVSAHGQGAWIAAKCYFLPHRLLPRQIRSYCYNKEKDFKFEQPVSAFEQIMRKRRLSIDQQKKIDAWLNEIDGADIVLATGGGYFTDAFGQHLEGILHTMRWAQQKRKLTAFLGQGLGPLTSPRLKHLAATILRAADRVALREKKSAFQFAQECDLPFTKWEIIGDDAFYLLHGFQNSMFKKASDKEARTCIGLNLRVASYSNLNESACQRISVALATVQSRFKNSWMPLPVDLCPESGDEIQVQSCICAEDISAVYQKPDTPHDLWALVQHCRVVITGSYHAAVFALSAGVPVIALAANAYYLTKFSGLQAFFPDGLRIVDGHAEDISSELNKGVEWAWHLPLNSRSEMKQQAQLIAANVEKAYSDFFKRLNI